MVGIWFTDFKCLFVAPECLCHLLVVFCLLILGRNCLFLFELNMVSLACCLVVILFYRFSVLVRVSLFLNISKLVRMSLFLESLLGMERKCYFYESLCRVGNIVWYLFQ